MGVRHSCSGHGGHHGGKPKDLLDGSDWLRSVVQHHQRKRHGVAGFDSFVIEPALTVAPPPPPPPPPTHPLPLSQVLRRKGRTTVEEEYREEEGEEAHTNGAVVPASPPSSSPPSVVYQDDGVRLLRVSILFRNNKEQKQRLYWLVKSAQGQDAGGRAAVRSLGHEIKVYTALLAELHKFLRTKKNSRARFLLNIPDFVFQERKYDNGRTTTRCHLVLEDVIRSKRCHPVSYSNVEAGLSLNQYKVFLGTLAQFHAVGLAWNIASKDDSALDLFPFLHQPNGAMGAAERQFYLGMYRKLLGLRRHLHPPPSPSSSSSGGEQRRQLEKRRSRLGRRRRKRLFQELCSQANGLLEVDLQADMCDPLGGLCLGSLLPTEVMFQHEEEFQMSAPTPASLPPAFKKTQGLLKDFSQSPPASPPVCAASSTCHRVHYGHIGRELAVSLFSLASADVRRDYIIFMLQSYCHVLTTTLELLDVDWVRHFGISFPTFVSQFYEQVPQAVLRAILIHMRLTNPREVDRLVALDKVKKRDDEGDDGDDDDDDDEGIVDNGDTDYEWDVARSSSAECTPERKVGGNAGRRETHIKYIPLTEARLDFLLRLLDLVHKPV